VVPSAASLSLVVLLVGCAAIEPPKVTVYEVTLPSEEDQPLLDVCAPLGGAELRTRYNRIDWFMQGRAWDTPETNCI